MAQNTASQNGRVSVVMAALNAADTIEEAMLSVLSAPEVGQLIVVNDGSSDGTEAKAKAISDPRICVVQGPQQGHAQVMNAGYAHATCELVAICDSDDFYTPNRLSWQCAWLDANPDFIAIAAAFASVDPSGRPLADLGTDIAEGEITDDLLIGDTITSLCTWLIRRPALIQSDGMRTWFVTAGDIDQQARLAAIGRVWYTPKVCYYYRLHTASVTHTQPTAQRDFYAAQARNFARQRHDTGTDDLMRGTPPEFTPLDPAQAPVSASIEGQMAGHLEGAAWRALAEGSTREAFSKGIQAVRQDWSNPARWKALAVIALRCLTGAKRP